MTMLLNKKKYSLLEEVINNFKKDMAVHKITAKQIAKTIEMSETQLSKILNLKVENPNINTLQAIYEAINSIKSVVKKR